jgi:ABC-type nitrate/sulfonate/bicarbonate transport system substrate-binding protein
MNIRWRLVVLLLFTSNTAIAQELRNVDVGDIIASSMTSFYVAVEKGHFREERLQVRLISMTGDVMVRAALSGNIAFGMGFGAPALAAANGLPIKIIAGMLQKPVYSLYASVGFKGKTTKDLKGRKVGITGFGAASEHAARAILNHHGLEPVKDVALIPLRSATNMLLGIQSGSVDAAILWPPHSFQAEKIGMIKLEYLGDLLDMPNSGLFTSEDILHKEPDLLRRFLRAANKGIRYLHNGGNKDEIVRLLMRKFKLEQDTAEAAYRFIINAHTRDGLLTDASVKKFIEVGLPGEHRNKNVSQIFDFGPLREVLSKGPQ